MKSKLLSLYLKALTFCIALLGFSACDDSTEYGTPSAEYKINGKIVSLEDEPIQNIQVVLQTERAHQTSMRVGYYVDGDTTYTDKKGLFKFDTGRISREESLVIHFDDIDGAENGEFEDGHTTIHFNRFDFKGGDGWFCGKVEKQLETITMNPKSETEVE